MFNLEMPELAQVEIVQDHPRIDTREALCAPRFEGMVRQIIETEIIDIIDEKITANIPFWKKLSNMFFCIMQTDFLGCGDKFKFISFQNLTEVNTFLLDLWQNHRDHFFKALACDPDGNRLEGDWDRDLEEGLVRQIFYWNNDLRDIIDEARFGEISFDQLQYDVRICLILEIFWHPDPRDIFDPNHGIKIRPYNVVQQNLHDATDSDSAFDSDISDI